MQLSPLRWKRGSMDANHMYMCPECNVFACKEPRFHLNGNSYNNWSNRTQWEVPRLLLSEQADSRYAQTYIRHLFRLDIAWIIGMCKFRVCECLSVIELCISHKEMGRAILLTDLPIVAQNSMYIYMEIYNFIYMANAIATYSLNIYKYKI